MLLHQTIKKITEDIEGLRFNTSVSQLMIFTNHLVSLENLDYETLHVFLQLLNPFAPHITEEINQTILKNANAPLSSIKWPSYDESLIKSESYTLAVQFNGKMRGTIEIEANLDESQIIELITNDTKLKAYFNNVIVIKRIHIPNKLINFVLKPS